MFTKQRLLALSLSLYLITLNLFGQAPCQNFGQQGIAVSQLSHQTRFRDLVSDASGRWVIAGDYIDESGTGLAAFRYLPDGSPDYSFGDGGLVAPPGLPAGGRNQGYAIGVCSDGTIIAAGGGEEGPRLVAITTTGGFRSSFGSSGIRSFIGLGPAYDLVIEGNFVYAIYATSAGFEISGVNTNGQVDPNFGTNGTVSITTPDSVLADRPARLMRQPDGKFIAAVVTASASADSNQLLIYRLQGNGSLDLSWSGDGFLSETEAEPYSVEELVLKADGSLWIAGDRLNPDPANSYVVSHRFSNFGDLDLSFNGSGRSVHSQQSLLGGAALGGNGQLWYAGAKSIGPRVQLLIGAWEDNGQVAQPLGEKLFVPEQNEIIDGIFRGIRPLATNEWLLWGTVRLSDLSLRGFLLQLSASGEVKVAFANDGYRVGDHAEQAGIISAFKQMDGKVLGAGLFGFTGSRAGHSAPVISRFLADGSPDSSFGFRGTTYRDVGSGNSFFHYVKELSDQRIFAAGRFENAAGFLAARYLPDGKPDSSFGGDGFVNYRADCFSCATIATAATVDSQGRYLMAGSAAYGLGNLFRDATLTRLDFDGTRDSTFGTNGITRVTLSLRNESFEDVAVLSDGSILTCGGYEYIDNQGVGAAMVAMKFQPDGRLFSSFADTARYTLDLDGITGSFLQVHPLADGNILLAYQDQATTDADSRRVGLVKLKANGDPDPAFGTQGRIELDYPGGQNYRFNGFDLLPDGKILLSGKLKSSQGDFTFLARFESNGQVDASFANQGFHFVDDPILTTLNGAPLLYSPDRLLMPGTLANHDAFSLICLDLAGNQVSIDQVEEQDVKVYPVPTKDDLWVELPPSLKEGTEIQLIGLRGEILKRRKVDKGISTYHFDLADLARGVYAIRVSDGEFVWMGKWMKE